MILLEPRDCGLASIWQAVSSGRRPRRLGFAKGTGWWGNRPDPNRRREGSPSSSCMSSSRRREPMRLVETPTVDRHVGVRKQVPNSVFVRACRLITRRSQIRILSPLPFEAPELLSIRAFSVRKNRSASFRGVKFRVNPDT